MDKLRCINPSEVEEGDLVAYIHGDAPPRVVKHVAECAFCAARVEQLRMTDAALLSLFYRSRCPTAETLAAFVLDQLPAVEKLRVAAHVRTCPACAEEVASVKGLADEPPTFLGWLKEKLSQAALAHQIAFSPSPLRGPGWWKGRFEADDLVVTLSVYGDGLTGRVRRRSDLSGVASGEAWLVGADDGRNVPQATIDERGRFQFDAPPPGDYVLLLHVAGRDIRLEKEVRIG